MSCVDPIRSGIPARAGVNDVLVELWRFARRSLLPLCDGHVHMVVLVRLNWRCLCRARDHFAKHLFGGNHTCDEVVRSDPVRTSVV